MNTPYEPSSLRTVTLMALRLGTVAFGGPAAHIAMLREEVVARRGWMSEQRFLDLMGITNLIPGPNSTEMVMHVGQERAGWRGLIAAGTGFILPAASITLALAWIYARWGTTPNGEAMLDGIKPVVLIVVLQAIWNLGRTGLKDANLMAVAGVVFGLYLLGLNELVLLFGGTALAVILKRRPIRLPSSSSWVGFGVLPLAVAGSQAVSDYSASRLFLTFLKIGATLYGSGYVLVAFLRRDFVDRLGWLTDQQLLDAIAIGQFTPGPVFTTATFVGYLAGGFPGALLATIGIFLPAFVFVAIAHRQLNRLMELSWTRPVLDGLNASAIGLMAGVAVLLAKDALDNPLAWVLAILAGLLLFRIQVNSALLILGGGIIGLAATLI